MADMHNFESHYLDVNNTSNQPQSLNEENHTKVSDTNSEISNIDKYLGLTRHEYDLIKSVNPNIEDDKLLSFVLKNKGSTSSSLDSNREISSSYINKNHPMNHIEEICNTRFIDSNLDNTTKMIIRKRKQLLQYFSESIGPEPKLIKKENSLWDVKDMNLHNLKPILGPTSIKSSFPTRPETSSLRTLENISFPSISTSNPPQTSFSFKIKDNTSFSTSLIFPKDKKMNITKTRLYKNMGKHFIAPKDCQLNENELKLIPKFTIEEIRLIPKFENWNPGTPSQILYIKNLAPSVTELDLASIFEHYQHPNTPKIVYRLLTTGKLRGQAFVDFHDIEMAAKALHDRNGLCLKDKPIIIQFGKTHTPAVS